MILPSRDYTALGLAILLNAAVWGSITLSRTYVDVLFLSSYPVSSLPFFFMGQTVIVLIMTLSVTPVASQGSGFVNAAIYLIAALSVLNGDIFVRAEIPYMAFIFSLWLSALPVLLLVISQNTIADAFDVRIFKKNLTWVTMAGNLGGLAIGFLTPTIIAYFNTEMLLYVLVALILFAAMASYQLKPLPTPARRHSQGHSPFNYALFRNIALCTFLMMLVDTFADYALKVELGRSFENKDEIGKFMGPFYGISSGLMLLFQGLGTQPLLKLFGVAGLISAIPWVCGISSLGLFLLPSLWTTAALRLSENALRFSFFSIGREIALKPLPARIRRAGKFLIIAVGYVGAGVGSLLLMIFAGGMTLKVLAVLLAVICLLWIFAALRLSSIYQDTLEEAIRIKRFNLNDEGTLVQERDNILQVAILALEDTNHDNIRFGFTLLERAHIDKVPSAAYPHINSKDPEIRVGFLSTVYRLHDHDTVSMMLKRLEVEQDGKVIWWLFKTLSLLAPETVVKKAEAMLEDHDPLVRAGAVVALLTGGGLSYLISAANTLKIMLKEGNPAMRKGAAYAISALKIGNLENELRALLEDCDELVNIAAMWAVTDQLMYQGNLNLIGALASKLGHGRVSHYASRTLKLIGEPCLPYLGQIIENAQWSGRQQSAARAAVRVLVTIRGDAADQIILLGVRKGSVMTRTQLAKECAMRAKRQPNSELLIKSAYQLILNEAHNVRLLKAACESVSIAEHAKLEISHRRKMAEARLLYWFDVYTKSTELIGVIPVILHENTSQKIAAQHATALEFLDTLTRDRILKQAIGVFEEKIEAEDVAQAMEAIQHVDDLWLERALNPPPPNASGGPMDITHKVMLLRKVKLFADLPGEILLTIAESCEDREIVKNEKLVARGDPPDGLYIIASGVISIEKDGVSLTELREGDFFGELGLFDDAPRKADAIAATDGMVLFLEKEVFDGLTEDLPEVLRALVRTVISYVK